MQITIDWANPVITEQEVLQIQTSDLDDFYVQASDFEKSNLFFVLLASFHDYHEKGDTERAAYLCFLIAYYLFVPFTPPGSAALAMHYINEAIRLNPLDLYQTWKLLIEKGN